MVERTLKRAIAPILALLAACGGGSGSTGLILPESAVLAEVRRDGTCVTSDGTVFCATDSDAARAPGGQRGATEVEPFPGQPPCDSSEPDDCQDQLPVTVHVSGFGPQAACAAASRPLGSSEPWHVGPLVPLAPVEAQVALPAPADDAVEDQLEVVLLCFDPAPASLPSEVETLASSGADVIFVPPLRE